MELQYFFFKDRVSFSSSWFQTGSVAEDDLELLIPLSPFPKYQYYRRALPHLWCRGLIPGPQACQTSALPTELNVQPLNALLVSIFLMAKDIDFFKEFIGYCYLLLILCCCLFFQIRSNFVAQVGLECTVCPGQPQTSKACLPQHLEC